VWLQVILDDRVELSSLVDGKGKTGKGVEVEAELVLSAVGIKLNNGLMKGSLSDALDERGAIKVGERQWGQEGR
jgi:hypothetical protein